MAEETRTPSREEIITWLKGLEGNAATYDNYMMGLKALNPKFAELETAIDGTSGALHPGGLKQEFEIAMRNPQFLDLLIKTDGENGSLDKILELIGTDQGQKLLTLSLGAMNGNIVAGGSTTAPTDELYKLVDELGLIETAKANG